MEEKSGLRGRHILWLSLWWGANIAFGIYLISNPPVKEDEVVMALYVLFALVHVILLIAWIESDDNVLGGGSLIAIVLFFIYLLWVFGAKTVSRINKLADKHLGD